MAVGKKVTNLSKGIADVNVLNHDNGEYEVVVCFSPDPEIIVGEGNSKSINRFRWFKINAKSIWRSSGSFWR